MGTMESLNGRKNIYGTKKNKERREGPLGTVLPDQFQTVAAGLASDWCQKNIKDEVKVVTYLSSPLRRSKE